MSKWLVVNCDDDSYRLYDSEHEALVVAERLVNEYTTFYVAQAKYHISAKVSKKIEVIKEEIN